MPNRSTEFKPEKALIFRIIRGDNLPRVLNNGLCHNNGTAQATEEAA